MSLPNIYISRLRMGKRNLVSEVANASAVSSEIVAINPYSTVDILQSKI